MNEINELNKFQEMIEAHEGGGDCHNYLDDGCSTCGDMEERREELLAKLEV